MQNNRVRAAKVHWSPALAGLVAALWLGSAGSAQQLIGTWAAGVYLVVLAVAVPLGLRWGVPAARRAISPRQAIWLAIGTLVLLLVAFAILYPIFNSGAHFSGGSDRDDDVTVATTRLLHLDYPYHAQTYLGNPISHLPGSYLLAIPFVAIGNGALQNFFWLAVLFVFLGRYLRDWRLALLLEWMLLFASPAVLRELMTGGDLISNNIYVLVLAAGLILLARADGRSRERAAVAALLGLALSSRANFILIVPFVLLALVHAEGWRAAARDMTIAGMTFLVVTLPFYLYDPGGFSPIDAEAKLKQYEVVLPGAETILLTAGAMLTAGLAWLSPVRSELAVLRNTAIVQAFFVVSSMILASIALDRISFGLSFVGYGLNILFFASVAVWPGLTERYSAPVGARGGHDGPATPTSGASDRALAG